MNSSPEQSWQQPLIARKQDRLYTSGPVRLSKLTLAHLELEIHFSPPFIHSEDSY